MKKLLAISLIPVFSFLILGAFAALPAHAQGPKEGCTLVRDVTVRDFEISTGVVVESGTTKVSKNVPLADSPLKTSDWGTICLVNTINNVVNWVFILMLTVSVGLIAFAGFMFMTAGADAEKQKQAGGMIKAAVIGIVIAILARIVPALVTGILL